MEEKRETMGEFRNAMVGLPVPVRETEKAAAYEVTIVTSRGEFKKMFWLPKSMIENNEVKGWLLVKKMEEIKDTLRHDQYIDMEGYKGAARLNTYLFFGH